MWDLREAIAFYMDSERKPCESTNVHWLSKLAFVVDMTDKWKVSACVIARKGKTDSQSFSEIDAFEAKLKLWQDGCAKIYLSIFRVGKVHLEMVKVTIMRNMPTKF